VGIFLLELRTIKPMARVVGGALIRQFLLAQRKHEILGETVEVALCYLLRKNELRTLPRFFHATMAVNPLIRSAAGPGSGTPGKVLPACA
jgi:hypothetical protein